MLVRYWGSYYWLVQITQGQHYMVITFLPDWVVFKKWISAYTDLQFILSYRYYAIQNGIALMIKLKNTQLIVVKQSYCSSETFFMFFLSTKNMWPRYEIFLFRGNTLCVAWKCIKYIFLLLSVHTLSIIIWDHTCYNTC